jgi:raffinose/stachyose/melibiose transport system substrate-binding protein
MKRQLLWLLIALLVVSMVATFSLAGCKTTPTETTETTETAAAEEEPIAEKEPIKLIFWDFNVYVDSIELEKPEEEWYISKAIARFENENPGVTIEFSHQASDKAIEMLTAAAMSKSGPDIVSMWGGAYVVSIKDSLLDLSDYFTPEEIDAVQGWQNHAVSDKYYGAPFQKVATAIYYNKSLFKDAGIDPEKDYDGTYDGLLALCEKLKNAGITPLIGGVAPGWLISFFEGSIFASQLTPGTAEKTLAEILAGEKNFATTPEMVAAFKASQDLYTKGYFNNDITTITTNETLTLFAGGKGAMVFCVSYAGSFLGEALGENLGILAMPSLKADSPGFGAAVGGMGLNAIVATNYGKYPIESTNFIRFMKTYEEERNYVEDTGNLPVVKGDYNDIITDPIQQYFIKLTNVPMMLDNLMPGNVSETWEKFEPAMLSSKMSVSEFLEAMDNARDEALAAKE